MAQFEPHAKLIENLGSLIYVAAEKRGGMFKPEEYLVKRPISFPFLLDEDRSVTKAYGVYQRLRLDAINIARPATFVINSQGKLNYIYVGRNQHDRAPIEGVLSALRDAKS